VAHKVTFSSAFTEFGREIKERDPHTAGLGPPIAGLGALYDAKDRELAIDREGSEDISWAAETLCWTFERGWGRDSEDSFSRNRPPSHYHHGRSRSPISRSYRHHNNSHYHNHQSVILDNRGDRRHHDFLPPDIPREIPREIVPRKRFVEPSSAPSIATASDVRIPRRNQRMSNDDGRSDRPLSPAAFLLDAKAPEEAFYQHAIERYTNEALLCERLWQAGIMSELEEAKIKEKQNKGQIDTSASLECVKSEEGVIIDRGAMVDDRHPIKREEDDDDSFSDNPRISAEAYLEYRKQYGSRVMKAFFNKHLDDEWFQLIYSPRHIVRHALKERARSWMEAKQIMGQIEEDQERFLEKARLGIGHNTQPAHMKRPPKRKRGDQHSDDEEERLADHHHQSKEDGKREALNRIPTSHLLSSQDSRLTVKVIDIPPHVTDAQLAHAFEEHTQLLNAPGAKVVERVASTTVGKPSPNSNADDYFCDSLKRTAWVIFVTREARENMIENLSKANIDANRGSLPTLRRSREESRNDRGFEHPSGSARVMLELDIDCSDPFGRTDIDYDGRGSAVPPITTSEGHSEEVSSKVPIKKASVKVFVEDDVHRPQVTVLSASLSSKERIGRDKNAALMLARSHDNIAKVPHEYKLDSIIAKLFGPEAENNEEDVLDVAIAYLRRVHLICFYGGAQKALREGDVLGCGSTTFVEEEDSFSDKGHKRKILTSTASTTDVGMIHLRLHNADELLKKAKDGAIARNAKSSITEVEGGTVPPVDMLVQRLDASISKAIEESNGLMDMISSSEREIIVNAEIDARAAEAEQDEKKVQDKWLADHSVLDIDGKARCAFHFCGKLFKGKHFLHKHLLKKHPEYLLGDQAKCHDPYMMEAWENAVVRPLPRILVNCGPYNMQLAILRGKEPLAEDPEPELRRRDNELRAAYAEEKRREHERRQREYMAIERERQMAIEMKTGFVDVDDMKEEKVEMNFAADVIDFTAVVAATKKKKKKNKLA